MSYIISKELRDSLIGLIILIQNITEDEYVLLENGKIYRFPFLEELKRDLEELDRNDI
jgi:hypothetical protein